jgi:hypothetical protein
MSCSASCCMVADYLSMLTSQLPIYFLAPLLKVTRRWQIAIIKRAKTHAKEDRSIHKEQQHTKRGSVCALVIKKTSFIEQGHFK